MTTNDLLISDYKDIIQQHEMLMDILKERLLNNVKKYYKILNRIIDGVYALERLSFREKQSLKLKLFKIENSNQNVIIHYSYLNDWGREINEHLTIPLILIIDNEEQLEKEIANAVINKIYKNKKK